MLCFILSLNSCIGQDNSNGGNVHNKYESDLLIERWGNEGTFDNNVNFREFFFYDENKKMIRNLYYSFENDNEDCIISDSSNYIETIYKYKGELLHLEEKYHPVFDSTGKVIGHELIYVHNHITRSEDPSSPRANKN